MRITSTSARVEVEAEICAIAASMANSEARLLALVSDFDSAEGWRPTGAPSCAHWLAELLDIEVCTAREKVRIARALRTLPDVRQRFSEGTMSYAKVRQLTRVATPDNETELIAVADVRPAGELARALAAWQARNDPKALEDRRRAERNVSFRDEPTGNRTVRARISLDHAALLEAVIDVEMTQTPSGDSDPRDSYGHRRADAFERIIARLSAGDASADAPPGRRLELILHRRVGETSLMDGSVLPAAVARQFSCEADVRVMTHFPDGSPADVGRIHRLVTPRLRRLVMERDGYHCQFTGCRARYFLDVHHVIHWEDGGATDMANLITYCGYHHRFVHRSEDQGG